MDIRIKVYSYKNYIDSYLIPYYILFMFVEVISMTEERMDWLNGIINYHIPRWEELPDIDLYMDQVLNFIEKYALLPTREDDSPCITKSMINNYVKLGLMPKPVKKKYSRTHVAYLIAITMLKQVLTISEVQQACIQEIRKSGEREAYNLFCSEQERAIRQMVGKMTQQNLAQAGEENEFNQNHAVVRLAADAFAAKILAQKMIQFENENLNSKAQNNGGVTS